MTISFILTFELSYLNLFDSQVQFSNTATGYVFFLTDV
jgi:hypothetical protein